MKKYIQPTLQVMPVETKDFLCQAVASPTGEPIVSGGEVISGGGTGFNPGGGL